MVNLIAGRQVIPEIIQGELTGPRLAAEALALLESPAALGEMRSGLLQVSQKLSGSADPMDAAATIVESYWKKESVHVP
jgi:lipid-A-disaccharide synthase